jgi:hypothetical protein
MHRVITQKIGKEEEAGEHKRKRYVHGERTIGGRTRCRSVWV